MVDYIYNSKSKILEVKVSGDIKSIEFTSEAVKKSLKRYFSCLILRLKTIVLKYSVPRMHQGIGYFRKVPMAKT